MSGSGRGQRITGTGPATDAPEGARGRTALLLGATGLVGGHCLDLLLADPDYRAVRTVTRRAIEARHPKLESLIRDFEQLDHESAAFAVDDVFCCLGTTIRKAGSRESFQRVDVEYVVTAAQLSLRAGAGSFLVVSAIGADPASRIFYNRCKGEMEARVRHLPLGAVWIVRPALLLGDRAEERLGERIAGVLLKPLVLALRGPLRKYRPIPASVVATGMIQLAKGGGTGGTVESDELSGIAAGGETPPAGPR